MSKITVIITNFNKREYIGECIKSVKDQTLSDFKCIIVDDGSIDGSKEVIEQMIADDNRFSAFFNENKGVAEARNFGILMADTEYVMPLDGDDYIEHTYLERIVKFFEALPEYTLYYGKWKFIGFNADYMNARLGNLHYTTYDNLLRSNSIHCSCAYKRQDAIDCGLFDPNLKGYEDWEFLIRLLNGDNKKVFWDSNISLFYRQLKKSRTSDDHANYQQRFNDIMNKNKKIYQEHFNI